MKKNNKIRPELASFILAATLLNTTAFAGFLPISVEKVKNISNQTEAEKILSEIEAKEQAQLSNGINYTIADATTVFTDSYSAPALKYAGPEFFPPVHQEMDIITPSIPKYAGPELIQMPKYAGPELIQMPKYAGPELIIQQMPKYAGPVIDNSMHSIVRYAGPEMDTIKPTMVRYAGPEMDTIMPTMVRYAGPEINTQLHTQVESLIARYAGPAAPVLTPIMPRYAGPETFEIQYTMPRYAGPTAF